MNNYMLSPSYNSIIKEIKKTLLSDTEVYMYCLYKNHNLPIFYNNISDFQKLYESVKPNIDKYSIKSLSDLHKKIKNLFLCDAFPDREWMIIAELIMGIHNNVVKNDATTGFFYEKNNNKTKFKLRFCHHCVKQLKSGDIKCAGCCNTYYCDKKCQKNDWKNHKIKCYLL